MARNIEFLGKGYIGLLLPEEYQTAHRNSAEDAQRIDPNLYNPDLYPPHITTTRFKMLRLDQLAVVYKVVESGLDFLEGCNIKVAGCVVDSTRSNSCHDVMLEASNSPELQIFREYLSCCFNLYLPCEVKKQPYFYPHTSIAFGQRRIPTRKEALLKERLNQESWEFEVAEVAVLTNQHQRIYKLDGTYREESEFEFC